jgi:hypothetical protein
VHAYGNDHFGARLSASIHQKKYYLLNQENKMKAYYYLLFRLYVQLMNPKNENDERTVVYLTTSTSTFLLCFLMLTIILFIDFYFFKILNQIFLNKSITILCMIVVGFFNYWFFIKGKKFLNYNFKTDKKGGYAVIGFIAILALSFVFIANKNRDKVFKERKKARIEIINS